MIDKRSGLLVHHEDCGFFFLEVKVEPFLVQPGETLEDLILEKVIHLAEALRN